MSETLFDCLICQHEFGIETYAGGECPRCKQDYQYDNDVYRIDLTPKQIKLLQDDILMSGVLEKVGQMILLLHQLEARDLDDCDVPTLAQLQYQLNKLQGSIFIKTVGRMERTLERLRRLVDDKQEVV